MAKELTTKVKWLLPNSNSTTILTQLLRQLNSTRWLRLKPEILLNWFIKQPVCHLGSNYSSAKEEGSFNIESNDCLIFVFLQEDITDTHKVPFIATMPPIPWCYYPQVTASCHRAFPGHLEVREVHKACSSFRLARRPQWACPYLKFITFSKPPVIKHFNAWADFAFSNKIIRKFFEFTYQVKYGWSVDWLIIFWRNRWAAFPYATIGSS